MLISAVGTRGEDGVVNLDNEHGASYTLKVLGASFPVLAARGVPYTTITVVPPVSHSGVIAVAVETPVKTKPWTFYLLSAEWLADPMRPWVNIENAFRPNRRRLGEIDTDGVIEVLVDCEVYTTAIQNNGRVAGRISADDACAYMAGVLSGADLRGRSQVLEQQHTEVERLRDAVGNLAGERLADAQKLRAMDEVIQTLEAQSRVTHGLLNSAMRFIGKVRGAVDTCWFPRRRIDQLLRNYYPSVTAPTDETILR